MDALRRTATAGIEWRAVEHDTTVPVDGWLSTADIATGDRERVLDIAGVPESSPQVGAARTLVWREEWLALPRSMVPAVVRPEAGIVTAGADALAYLAGTAVGRVHPSAFRIVSTNSFS